MASALSNALKKKKELERALAEINQFIALYDQFSDSARTTPAKESTLTPQAVHRILMTSGAGKSTRGRPAEFAEIMEAIIRETGVPMSRTDLVEAVEKRGTEVPSEDKPRYLGTILWRNKERFVNIANEGYIMADMIPADDVKQYRLIAEAVGADDDVAILD